ncbi:MAG: glycosyltransferase family 2 protein [Clostridiales bacterium]|nr:glycosyltransferase family 2 protein [Clostridiales bacterium]
MADILYIAVPCYNEQEVLEVTAQKLTNKLTALIDADKISPKSKILFINDGSRDKTWEIMEKLHGENKYVSCIKLSRNKGHQNALMAGLMTAKEKADMVISIDADLQDDIEVIDDFIAEYYNGCDIVYGVRSARDTDTAFKRGTAQGYYKVMNAFGVDIVYNHADYRLMSKRALEALADFKEVNLFLRGIVPLIGFKTAKVFYERHERFAGESKYPLKKMLALAYDGITSFSVTPIKLITALGAVLAFLGAGGLLTLLILLLCNVGVTVGHAILCSIWCVCGLILLGIGVIGSYIGKVYMETKARPRYFIETILD